MYACGGPKEHCQAGSAIKFWEYVVWFIQTKQFALKDLCLPDTLIHTVIDDGVW